MKKELISRSENLSKITDTHNNNKKKEKIVKTLIFFLLFIEVKMAQIYNLVQFRLFSIFNEEKHDLKLFF